MNILNNIYEIYLKNGRVNTDTRTLKEGEVFFALKGGNFNGNRFVTKALELGAEAVVIDEDQGITNSKVFLVDDALETLQDLARLHRSKLNIPVLGITGSNGKTTTKELIRDVLLTSMKVVATKGNLNNHIGVPLTLLSIPLDTELAIIEMGANHQKEIEFLCSIAQPTHGYITNFGKAHLEGFGGEEGVIKGKSELYDHLRSTQGTVFINHEDPIQISRGANIESFTFGSENADCIIKNESDGAQIKLVYKKEHISSQLFGSYNFTNAAAAIAIGEYFKISPNHIHTAIASYKSSINRSEILQTETNHLVMDAYNANPTSMGLSITSFLKVDHAHKSVILADMFELGAYAAVEHQKIVDLLKGQNVNVYLVGELFFKTRTPKDWLKFKSTDEIKIHFHSNPIQNNYVLLKGSRGMKLETLVEVL